MDTEQIIDEIQEIICQEIDEPAGSGCGYGLTEEGQINLKTFIETYFKPFERNKVMSNETQATVLEEKIFEGSAIQRAEVRHETSGYLAGITRKKLVYRELIIACSLDEAKADLRILAEANAKKLGITFDKRMLEVKVGAINFLE